MTSLYILSFSFPKQKSSPLIGYRHVIYFPPITLILLRYQPEDRLCGAHLLLAWMVAKAGLVPGFAMATTIPPSAQFCCVLLGDAPELDLELSSPSSNEPNIPN